MLPLVTGNVRDRYRYLNEVIIKDLKLYGLLADCRCLASHVHRHAKSNTASDSRVLRYYRINNIIRNGYQ
jgi:hypothetical protein